MSDLLATINKLKAKAEKLGITLTINENKLHENKRHVLWYGGQLAVAQYKGYKITLNATGDVYAFLSSANNKGEEDGYDIYDEVKDKYNNGQFYEIMSAYIHDDNELNALCANSKTIALPVENPLSETVKTKNYELIINNNNWWEIMAITPDRTHHDLGLVCESDYWDEAVEEMLSCIHDIVHKIQQKNK